METLPEDSTAKSLFFRAISNGTTEDVRTLVRLGANVNWREDTEKGFTGLQIAAANGRQKKLEFLLSQGADVNLAAKNGGTPLLNKRKHHFSVSVRIRNSVMIKKSVLSENKYSGHYVRNSVRNRNFY